MTGLTRPERRVCLRQGLFLRIYKPRPNNGLQKNEVGMSELSEVPRNHI